MILRYKKRISGPLIDRIDLHVHVPAVQVEKLTSNQSTAEASKVIQERVQNARKLQIKRLTKYELVCNAEMSTKLVKTL